MDFDLNYRILLLLAAFRQSFSSPYRQTVSFFTTQLVFAPFSNMARKKANKTQAPFGDSGLATRRSNRLASSKDDHENTARESAPEPNECANARPRRALRNLDQNGDSQNNRCRKKKTNSEVNSVTRMIGRFSLDGNEENSMNAARALILTNENEDCAPLEKETEVEEDAEDINEETSDEENDGDEEGGSGQGEERGVGSPRTKEASSQEVDLLETEAPSQEVNLLETSTEEAHLSEDDNDSEDESINDVNEGGSSSAKRGGGLLSQHFTSNGIRGFLAGQTALSKLFSIDSTMQSSNFLRPVISFSR